MTTSHLIGTVRGNAIELDQPSGLVDGQRVSVELHPYISAGSPGDGIRQSAGAWSDAGEELDRWLEEVYRARELSRPDTPQ